MIDNQCEAPPETSFNYVLCKCLYYSLEIVERPYITHLLILFFLKVTTITRTASSYEWGPTGPAEECMCQVSRRLDKIPRGSSKK